MLNVYNLLLIGANSRNAGKTTLASEIIRKFAPHYPIIGLKVTRIRPGEESFHGAHEEHIDQGWSLTLETDPHGSKDTHRMLAAGAHKVYYIRCDDNSVEDAFLSFMKEIGHNSLIVCESRSLRQYIKPGLFILMIKDQNIKSGKNLENYLSMADIVSSRGNQKDAITQIVSGIEVMDQKWLLKKAD